MADFVKKYCSYIKQTLEKGNPSKAQKLILAGLKEEDIRIRFAADKRMPKAYRELSRIAINSTRKGIAHPESYAWTNIFAPVEILECFGLNCVSIECIASFLSGFLLEDFCIDYAENHGIAPTLCSYHKSFVGGVDAGIIPTPKFAVTTSMICDGNINTFHYLSKKYDVDHYIIDVPDEYSESAVAYVVSQLEEMTEMLEQLCGRKLDLCELKRVIHRENQSKALLKEFVGLQKDRCFPNTLTLNMYLLFATHLQIGTPEVLKFFQHLVEEARDYPLYTGKKLFWVHLFPYYQETLQKYFNYGTDYCIQAGDMNLDYLEPLDINHPMEALAKKMLLNLYNGPFERKVAGISKLVEEMDADAVINFCHWGCKQSSGGVMLLKEEMKKKDIPMLILDGDAMDRRNSHDGQIKTRLEAFLELLDTEGEERER
jgi:benzoyl-CoA reductase/2-hydroxyglutaryl-CoA dehydratase subunit BcrC/BadD/HgdB